MFFCWVVLGATAAWLVLTLFGLVTGRSPPAPLDTTEMLKSRVVLLAYLELKGDRPHTGYEYAFWERVQARAAEIALMMKPADVVEAIVSKHPRFTQKYE